ncbi:hypothetical protein CR161_12220 [Prosthecochloris sp. ZM]|uniref:glycosyltransferase family 4 protein n=1 Tax=Prosthecochloris sp. ZM TaxID=2283143 RepID=UPI000DF780C7|nr:glycosyltransferase family 4 protein [Prosthecochloris sp. ZM]RDD31398.1 hypothetical protein CR161_12220 [Prosthecochloris sp. ZM]
MKLTLFFSKNISLQTWKETGMLEREIALYRKHAEKGILSSFITYDTTLSNNLPTGDIRISIFHNRYQLPKKIYHTLAPFLHFSMLAKTDIIKTNQISGSLAALRAAKLFRKPLIARCGYMHSEFSAEKHGVGSRKTKKSEALEFRLFSNADAVIVTTDAMKKSIVNRIPDSTNKITVLPNYVDTALFSPEASRKEYDVIFIGRLSEQKNIVALLEALTALDCSAMIIGSSSNAEKLQQQYPSPKIRWLGNVCNTRLPDYLNKAKIFILPSHYEGHPKTLIEAMACGCAVIGGDSPGINNVIRNGVNGVLSEKDAFALQNSIEQLLINQELRTQLGTRARSFALDHYSLDTIAEKEYRIIRNTVKQFRIKRAPGA